MQVYQPYGWVLAGITIQPCPLIQSKLKCIETCTDTTLIVHHLACSFSTPSEVEAESAKQE